MDTFNIKNYLSKFIPFLKIFLAILILFLIINEIHDQSLNLEEIKKKFDLNYLSIALIFFIFTQLSGSYIFFLILKLFTRPKLFYTLRIIFTGQFLDFFPFLGLVYKGKKLKDDLKFKYKNFISSYLFLLQIGLINLSLIICLIYFVPIQNFFKSYLYIFWLSFFIIIISLVIIFHCKKLCKFIEKFKFITNSKKKTFIPLQMIFNYLPFLRKTLSIKFFLLKCISLDFLSHIFYTFCFFFIFKCYQIQIEIFELIIFYLIFAFSTQIKILPKNYGVDELIGSYLIEITSGSFLLGLTVMITLRIIVLFSTLILSIFFNLIYRVKTLKLAINIK